VRKTQFTLALSRQLAEGINSSLPFSRPELRAAGRFAFRRRHRRPLARIRITRSISHRTGAAYHDFFDLEEPYQKLGISNAINKASIDYYRKLGLSRVDLEATLDRGGYTWARYGFLPTQESWDALRLVLRVKLDDPTLNIAADDQQAMLNLLESRDPHTIWDIADYRVPVVRKGETLPIGNHLLSNTDWEGSLDLNDAASMNRFDHYVRPEK
jgi:hypothetical protein